MKRRGFNDIFLALFLLALIVSVALVVIGIVRACALTSSLARPCHGHLSHTRQRVTAEHTCVYVQRCVPQPRTILHETCVCLRIETASDLDRTGDSVARGLLRWGYDSFITPFCLTNAARSRTPRAAFVSVGNSCVFFTQGCAITTR